MLCPLFMALHAEILDVLSMSWRVPTSGVRLLHAYCLPSVSLCCSSMNHFNTWMARTQDGTPGALGKESFKACMGPCSTCCSWQFSERDMQTEGETLLFHTRTNNTVSSSVSSDHGLQRRLSSRIDDGKRRQPASSRPARPHDTHK